MNEEKYYLFYLKSIHGLKESLIWEYLKNGFLPKQLYDQPPAAVSDLVCRAKNDTTFKEKILTEFNDYRSAICILDRAYPNLLKTIFDPPLFLFYQGNLDLLSSDYLLTVVGSRTLTQYHQATLHALIKDLSDTPMIIVSGLAYGIDALAHKVALENNLPTIAVLGSGFADDVLYPQQNLALAKQILDHHGLILSEYPPTTKAAVYQFPKRNRILSGLSRTTVVISGAQKSGTLITAQCALDNAREVYALPGNINLILSQGPNDLIYQGANILLTSQDILNTYDLKKDKQSSVLTLNDEPKQVYEILQNESLSFDKLQKKLTFSSAELNAILSQLEIMNLISLNKFNQWEII